METEATRKERIQAWLKAAGTRAVKTVGQTAVAILSMATVLDEVNWHVVASASALSGVLSLLTSIFGLPELNGNTVNSIKAGKGGMK